MQKETKYSPENVTVTMFNACDDATKKRFKNWALSLKPELDGGECGADENGEPLPNSAYLWVLHHNATPQFTDGGVYQTYIFLDKNTGEFLATGNIVPDDRDIAKKYKIGGHGFWGFVNVRRDLRGHGLGKLVSVYMDEHVQKFVDGLGQSTDFNLFTANEVAVRIYKSLGFNFVRQIHIDEFDADEDLYTKTYTPQKA
jgi:GNAT superfamily N-acetyltransferase